MHSPTQAEVTTWLNAHLPGRTTETQALVLAEEVGELCRAVVKRHQGIRGTHAEWTAQLRAEAADVLLTLYALASGEGFDLHTAAAEKWAQILHRDPNAHRPPHTDPPDTAADRPVAVAVPCRQAEPAINGVEAGGSWDEQVRAGVHQVFGTAGAQIMASAAVGALAYRLGQAVDQYGGTPAAVLAQLDESDRRFAVRADDPAAFLARKVAEL